MSDVMLDDLIRRALNDPLGPDQALGWSEVVERARRTDPRPVAATRNRRRVLVAALLVAAIIVPVAVAFRGPLITLIEGKPAPSSVKTTFASWNVLKARGLDELRRFERAHGAGHSVIGPLALAEADKAEGVVELQVAAGTISLWQAPVARGGGECWLLAFQLHAHAFGDGSCDQPGPKRSPVSSFEWVASKALGDLVILHARVNGVTSAELIFPGGRTEPMQVVAGHAIAAVATNTFPTALVVKNAAGTVIETQRLHVPLTFASCRSQGLASCSGARSFGGGGFSSFGSVSFGSSPKHEKGTR